MQFNSIASEINVPMVVASPDASKTAAQSLLDLIAEHHDKIIKRLNQEGAILFRGFACQDIDYFNKAIELCDLGSKCSTKDYAIPRTLLPNEIYTSSDLPGHIPIPLHHEKPRSKTPPNHIYFCCVTPAEQGGGTVFANAAAIWRDMPEKIQNKITEHGVIYKQFFHGESIKQYWLKKILGNHCIQRWSRHFGTEDKAFIEKKLRNDKQDWNWINRNNDLIVSSKLPGALIHPLTDQILWFNASEYLNYYSNLIYGALNTLHFYKYAAAQYLILNDMLPLVCHYGNGQAFSPDEIADINRVVQKHARVLNWQKGDFMIVDNYTFMHGKEAHQGNRLLYSCMTMLQG